MPKIPVRMFRLPTLTLAGHPWRADEDDKLFWVNASFDGSPFVVDTLAVLETGRYLRARNLQQGADGKHRFQFKGIAEKALAPGLHLYDAAWPVAHEKKLYLIPLGAQNQPFTATKGKLKSSLFPEAGVEVEFRKHDAEGGKYLVLASARKTLPALPGAVYTVEPDTGAAFDAALVTSGTLEPRDLADFVKKAFRFPGLPTVNALYSINLRVHGWVVLPPPLWDEEFEETVGKNGVRIMTKAWAQFSKLARNAAAQPGGIATSDLEKRLGLPEAVFSFLTGKLIADGELKAVDGYLLPTADPKSYLSPVAQKALVQLDERGLDGVDVESEPSTLFAKTYRDLARMGLAVQTETPMVYGLKAWDQIRQKLCGPGTLGKQWRIAEVKDTLDVSRKPVLGVLNQLEAEGWLERQEDHRLVVKEAPSA